MITIFCWILGVSASEFPVDIEDSLSVGHLKDAIVKKNSNAFPGVDAAQLTLWKVFNSLPFHQFPSQLFYQVSIQISRQLKNQVNEHQFLEEGSLLAGELLEEIFPPPQPSKKTLHIVVRPPSNRESSFFHHLHSPHCVLLLLLLCHLAAGCIRSVCGFAFRHLSHNHRESV